MAIVAVCYQAALCTYKGRKISKADGRQSTREMARNLDIPASTVRERMNRRLQTKAIRVGVICDARSMGLELASCAYISVEAAHSEDALQHLPALYELGQVCSASLTGEAAHVLTPGPACDDASTHCDNHVRH